MELKTALVENWSGEGGGGGGGVRSNFSPPDPLLKLG